MKYIYMHEHTHTHVYITRCIYFDDCQISYCVTGIPITHTRTMPDSFLLAFHSLRYVYIYYHSMFANEIYSRLSNVVSDYFDGYKP